MIHGYQYKSAWLAKSSYCRIKSFRTNRKLEMPTTLMLWQYAASLIKIKNFWTCSTQNICRHRICAVRFLVDEVASSILCIVKGNRRCSSDLPQHRWSSIFSVRRICYLCSNPTNRTQFSFQHRFSARYCKCTKMKIGKKKFANINCCDSPNSPKFFPLQSFLLYGIHNHRWLNFMVFLLSFSDVSNAYRELG